MHEDAPPRSPTDGNNLPVAGQLAYSVPSAAQILDVGERTVWDLLTSGEIASFKVGRSRRIARQDLEAYVARKRGAE